MTRVSKGQHSFVPVRCNGSKAHNQQRHSFKNAIGHGTRFSKGGQNAHARHFTPTHNIVKSHANTAAHSTGIHNKLDLTVTKQLIQVIGSLLKLISGFQQKFDVPTIGYPTPPAHHGGNPPIEIHIPGHSGPITIEISVGGEGGHDGGGYQPPYYPPSDNPTPPTGDPKPDFAKPEAGEKFNRLTDANHDRANDKSLPGPREISNAVANQHGKETSNANGASDLIWSWGQFIDHDVTLTRESEEKTVIPVPKGDPGMDPTGTGKAFIPFTKSDTSYDDAGVGHQTNDQTPLIDASMVYGTNKEQTDGMRTHSGGKMKMENGHLPASNDKNLVLSGDPRAAEQPGLLSLQTLFVREHNRLADKFAAEYPSWDDEQIFQHARKMVAAEIQAITYNEFLPTLIGTNPENAYAPGAEKNDGKISNEFSTAAFRLGHTLVSEEVAYKDADGNLKTATLDEVFFKPEFTKEKGIGAILSGQSEQTAEKADTQIVDGLRDRLFGGPGSPGMDLASLNIMRGRDHGMPSYNDMREALGYSRITSFDDPEFQDGVGAKLASVYDSPDDIDLWVGGLAEKPAGNSMVGQTFTRIVADQFAKTAAADANFYTRSFSYQDQAWLKNLSLADIIRANTENTQIDDTPFIATD